MEYVIFPLTIKLGRVAYNLTMYELKPLLLQPGVKFYLILTKIENFRFFFYASEGGGDGR